MDYITAASLGCRFATSYRALMHQGRLEKGQWVAVHGCGGVGLSAVMIAQAAGARIIGIGPILVLSSFDAKAKRYTAVM